MNHLNVDYKFSVPVKTPALKILDPARIHYTECPLCASSDFSPLWRADCSGHPLYKPSIPKLMQWMRCSACEHVFTDGYYTPEALDIIFSDTNANQLVGADYERQRPIAARMIEKVLPFAADGAWLDVGFGNAALLFTAQEFGFDPVGLDLRAANVDTLKKTGVTAHCRDIVDLDQDEHYAVISMADVLEHMPYPVEGLSAAHRLLKPGGVLLASMPNMDSMLWRLMNASNSNPYWGELEHYHNFGRRSLYRLLQENGFRPVRYGISERYRVCMEVVAVKV